MKNCVGTRRESCVIEMYLDDEIIIDIEHIIDCVKTVNCF